MMEDQWRATRRVSSAEMSALRAANRESVRHTHAMLVKKSEDIERERRDMRRTMKKMSADFSEREQKVQP